MEKDKQINYDDFFKELFASSSGTGDEELLKVASQYALQITSEQLRCIMFMHWAESHVSEKLKEKLHEFIIKWFDYKRYNNSALFVMRVLDSVSLRKFLGENSIKVNIEK